MLPKAVAIKGFICRKFSVQNDWLIYCKFAARICSNAIVRSGTGKTQINFSKGMQ